MVGLPGWQLLPAVLRFTLLSILAADVCCMQAVRAEVDSGSLVDELMQLMEAKAQVAQQRADLDR